MEHEVGMVLDTGGDRGERALHIRFREHPDLPEHFRERTDRH
jgi:hypothetical protein